MKLHAIAILALALVLVGAGPASATHFSSFTGGADCSGFWGNGRIYFAQPTMSVDLHYEVTLSQGSTTVKYVTGTIVVYQSAPDFSYTEPWGMQLCGDYTVAGRFWFTSTYGDDERTFNAAFTCECDGEDGCHFTPGYWKNHPEDWPVLTLSLGGVSYTQLQLLEILNMPVRKDPTIILAHHLIAAKLNVLSGADDSINDEIAAADALLAAHPIGSKPTGDAKDDIIDVKNDLCAYNETIVFGCEGYIVPTFDRALGSSPDPGVKSTWGAIKSIYR